MKTHIFTTLSNLFETTIQILEQEIPAPTAQQCMDAIRKYTNQTTLTKETGDAARRATQYSRGGDRGCGHGGRGHGRQKHKCTRCTMDNHTTEACGKRKLAENDTKTSDSNRNDPRTCYHCGLPGHFKTDYIHFKRARDQRDRVNEGTASASLATAGDRDLI